MTYPLSFLPYRALHFLGKIIGPICYYLLTEYRKRSLSNLALAKDLKLSNNELIQIAKKSFQNLAINILEYPKLSREKDFSKLIICENPKMALDIYKSKKGIIFFCGHQANWEVLFLDGNLRMKGIAVGKPIKNKYLYQWIVSIREKTGGKIIIPQKAMKEAIKSLKKGEFVGIVGDQGMPESNYSFPFFGRNSFNSYAPALLSYKTESPIIVATTVRNKGKYYIRYSSPIWPDINKPIEIEIKNLMDQSLKILEASIKEKPDQWLWQHNKWKQQTPEKIMKRFRHDCIGVILPEEETHFSKIEKDLSTIKLIYPTNHISLFVPEKMAWTNCPIKVDEIIIYKNVKEILIDDFRFKLIFNFTNNKKIKKHYKRLSAFDVLSIPDLKKIANKNFPDKVFSNLSELLLYSLCRSNTLLTTN